MEAGIHTVFWVPKSVRVNDRHIMNIFYSWGYNSKDLYLLNLCRLYLNVITVADISNFEGSHIDNDIMICKKARKRKLIWPNQIYPPLRSRRLWTQAIKRLCVDTNQLVSPLGRWTTDSHQIWDVTIEHPSRTLFVTKDGETKALYRNTNGIYPKIGRTTSEQLSGTPVKVAITPTGYKIVQNINNKIDELATPRTLQPSLKWEKISTGQLYCNKNRKFTTM